MKFYSNLSSVTNSQLELEIASLKKQEKYITDVNL